MDCCVLHCLLIGYYIFSTDCVFQSVTVISIDCVYQPVTVISIKCSPIRVVCFRLIVVVYNNRLLWLPVGYWVLDTELLINYQLVISTEDGMWLPKWRRNVKRSHTLPLLWRNADKNNPVGYCVLDTQLLITYRLLCCRYHVTDSLHIQWNVFNGWLKKNEL